MNRHRLAFIIIAIILLSIPVVARADYRTDNTWVGFPSEAAKNLRMYMNFDRSHVTFAKCHGDATGDYPVNRGRGMYHHMYCGAVLRNMGVVRFDYWTLGPKGWNFRVSDWSYVIEPAAGR